jgi:GNAT superfamily N-acetyltransferase
MTNVRQLVPGDFDRWLPLWEGYLHFYREDLPEEVTRATFERLCEGSAMFGLVAEAGAEAEAGAGAGLDGIVHALLHPSTWSQAPVCYLEDLFVAPAARGSGAARALIEAVADEATRRGAVKVYWHTQEFNAPARSLYDVLATRVSFVVYERNLAR